MNGKVCISYFNDIVISLKIQETQFFSSFPFCRLKKFLCYLSQAGFRVSRTHFDPMGVRTDAPLIQFKAILLKYSTPTYTGGQSEGQGQSASEDTAADRLETSVTDKAEASS